MSSSAARESRQTTRLCRACRQRKTKYRLREGVRTDRQDTPCFACGASAMNCCCLALISF